MKKKIIIETSNFLTVKELCQNVLEESTMVGLVGYPGAGKTTAFKNFKHENENVFYVTASASMTPKQFYIGIIKELGLEGNYESHKLHELIKIICFFLKTTDDKNLLIIDEAGKFKPRFLEYLHELRDATEENTGIVIAGPKYFEDHIVKWKDKGIVGVPEFYRRVNYWEYLRLPTKDEIVNLCKAYEVKDRQFIIKLSKEQTNFADITSKINIHFKEVYKSEKKRIRKRKSEFAI